MGRAASSGNAALISTISVVITLFFIGEKQEKRGPIIMLKNLLYKCILLVKQRLFLVDEVEDD